jgi:predicted nucleic-acid-binding protein
MIGVDTNILLRAVTSDHRRLAEIAHAFLRERSVTDPAVVNPVVLAEFVWSLRSKYKATRADIIAAIEDIVDSPDFIVLHRSAALSALQDYRDGVGAFTDVLIAQINVESGCRTTVTFDRSALAEAGFTLLS